MSTTTLSIPADEVAIAEVSSEWSPDYLRKRIAQEKELRSIIDEYCDSQMIENKHYYVFQAGQKPALGKQGALNLCNFFKVLVIAEIPIETYHEDDHYSVRYRVGLVSTQNGKNVADGDGLCSTKESRYAYSSGNPHVPTPNLADYYYPVLEMSYKRAIVTAALRLPFISERFTQELADFSTPTQSLPDPSKSQRQPPRTACKRGKSDDIPITEQPAATTALSQSVKPVLLKNLFDRIDQCGLDREVFREYLIHQMGVQGTKELSPEQLQQCFNELDTRQDRAFQPQDVPETQAEAEPEIESEKQGPRSELFKVLKTLQAELTQAEKTQGPGEPHANTLMDMAQWIVRVYRALEHEDTPNEELINYLTEVNQARAELAALMTQAAA